MIRSCADAGSAKPSWFHLATIASFCPRVSQVGFSTTVVENPTWETLGQNEAMVAKWNQLGFADPASAHDLIMTRFDYSFSWLNLGFMAVVLIGYFVMMLQLSDREYRDVIAEKFGNGK